MKHTKKLFSLALAFIMAMALMVPAFAAQEGELTGGSITINNAVPGQTYSIYQILYLESYNAAANAYSYKANSAWANFVNSDAIKDVYLDVDAQGYVTWHKNLTCELPESDEHKHGDDCYTPADAAAFAELAQAEVAKKGSTIVADPTSEIKVAPDAPQGEDYSTVTFNNLKLGYYLVDTSLGTLCSLDTTNPEVVMFEKNGVPTSGKTVQEDSTSTYGTSNTADIIDTINYQVTITVPGGKDNNGGVTANPGAQDYVLHDEMDEGLVFGSVTGITLNGEAVDADDYDVKKTDLTDGCTFEVEFKPAFCASLKKDNKVVVSYTAKFDNIKEITAGQGYENNAWLTYGDKQTQTPATTTSTKTFDVDVFKFYKNGSTETGLADAEFKLYKEVETSDVKKTYYAVASKAENDDVYTLTEWTETADSATVFTSPADGLFTIHGLDADTYHLVETEAPDGYNKLANPVTIVIDEAGHLNPADAKDTNGNGEIDEEEYATRIEVENKSGAELPSTGGMGTTIFYVVGGVLMAGAAILLITKKKMSDDQ